MPNNPNLLGYVVYLIEIFLPGVGFGELLGAWESKGSGLGQRVGYAFGIGLSVDTAVLMVRTLGFTIDGHRLAGIDLPTIYFILGLGAAALLASLAIRRKFTLPVRPSGADAALTAVTAILALMVASYIEKFPIFPEFPGQDFGNHVQIAEGLISGTMTTIPHGILYYGVHYQLASALLLVGGEPLVTVERTMAILVVLSPFLVYAASSRLFSNASAGLVAAALFVFSGSIWFDSVFNSGLYANFFGILIALFFVAILLDLSERIRSVRAWLLFAIVLVAVYFSHYTTVTLLPAILLAALVQYVKARPAFMRLLIPSLVSVAPGVIVVLASPRTIRLVLHLGEAGGGVVTGSTTLSSLFSFFPAFGYLALEVYDDIAFVFLFAFAAICVYKVLKSKSAVLLILPFWCAALLISSPQNVSAWRFSYEALLPLTLMAAYGIYSLLPRLKIQRRRSGESNAIGQYARVGAVLFLLMAPVVVGSWGTTMVSYDVTGTQLQAQSQHSVYTALYWLKDNTPPNSTYLTVTDWRFLYSQLFFGRNSTYQYFNTEEQALAYAQQNGYGYIIVTALMTVSLNLPPQDYPWNSFQTTSNATLVYSNSDVEVFQVS